MKTKIIYCLIVYTVLLVNGCTDDIHIIDNEQGPPSSLNLRSSYDNYFDYENSAQTSMKNEYGAIVTKRLPWQYGISNAGVPMSWCDPNIESKDKSIKKYTKDKGWELVYSNVMEATAFKYIGLYNKYTGVMRFFMTIFANPGNSGTSSSIWGLQINNSTSLLNFTYNLPKSIEEKSPSPLFITTPTGAISNNQYNGVGLQNGVWYGIELTCAYDPSTVGSNKHYLTLMGRAITKTITIGEITSVGNINGSIKGTVPTSSTSLSFSDMFNKSGTDKSINLNSDTGTASLGEKIDNGISKNDSFFKGLWNNAKSNASKWISSGLESGAKKGIEAILTHGGSVVGEAIGGLFNSLIGGGNKEVDLKVDLELTVKSQVSLNSTEISQGWSDVTLPLPGSITSSTVIYNKPLGVWNLKETPTVISNLSVTWYYYPMNPNNVRYYEYTLSYNTFKPMQVIINPEIAKTHDLANVRFDYVTDAPSHFSNSSPYGLFSDTRLYKSTSYSVYGDFDGQNRPIGSTNFDNTWSWGAGNSFYCRVSFDLVDKKTKKAIFYSRYFKVKEIRGTKTITSKSL